MAACLNRITAGSSSIFGTAVSSTGDDKMHHEVDFLQCEFYIEFTL